MSDSPNNQTNMPPQPERIHIRISDIKALLAQGYTRLEKDNKGAGSIETHFNLTPASVKMLFSSPHLKGLRSAALPPFVLIDEEGKDITSELLLSTKELDDLHTSAPESSGPEAEIIPHIIVEQAPPTTTGPSLESFDDDVEEDDDWMENVEEEEEEEEDLVGTQESSGTLTSESIIWTVGRMETIEGVPGTIPAAEAYASAIEATSANIQAVEVAMESMAQHGGMRSEGPTEEIHTDEIPEVVPARNH